jgi:fucose permease
MLTNDQTGWVVQFLVSVRGGYAGNVGYVAAGFWGGMTLGRVILADVVHKFGERRMIFILTACALVMQILFWFIPNVIADAVLISLLGFFIAPFFPVGVSVMTKLLPRELHVGAVGKYTQTLDPWPY